MTLLLRSCYTNRCHGMSQMLTTMGKLLWSPKCVFTRGLLDQAWVKIVYRTVGKDAIFLIKNVNIVNAEVRRLLIYFVSVSGGVIYLIICVLCISVFQRLYFFLNNLNIFGLFQVRLLIRRYKMFSVSTLSICILPLNCYSWFNKSYRMRGATD